MMPIFASSYFQGILTRFLIFTIFAVGYNIIFGYTGLSSLGHAAFFGASGYAVAVLKLHYGIDLVWVGVPLGIVVAGIVSIIFGFISLRVSGIYFLLVTFALGQLLFSVAWNVKWLNSPGMQGIAGLSLPSLGVFGYRFNAISFYYFVFALCIVCIFVMKKILTSPFGIALIGIKKGEEKMESLGFNTWVYKYVAFIISGLFSGVAGSLFAYYNYMISPSHLGVETSFLPMCMAIIGGSGTLLGPAVGAGLIVFVEHFASIVMPERWPLILGGIFVVAIMFAREGIGVYIWKIIAKGYTHGSSSG